MKICSIAALLLAAALIPAFAQDNPAQAPSSSVGGGWQGRRGGRGWGGAMGSGTVGTVTEVAPDHFTIKTELGDIYTIHYSANTRIMKQQPPRQGQGEGRSESQDQPAMGERTPPQPIKATEIKVGDVITAGGDVDTNAKSVGAIFIMLVDPERAKQMREMEANFGKTWLFGHVTAINETKVTLQGGPKNTALSFVADENTTFRKRRDPITLADIQVGDMVRVEGAIKDGTFIATNVSVMGPPPNGSAMTGPRNAPPATSPQ